MGKYDIHELIRQDYHPFPPIRAQEEIEEGPRAHKKIPQSKPHLLRQKDLDFNREVQITVLSIANLHEHGKLFINYLKARHETFINQKGWDLPQTDGMEFDQYDTPLSYAVIVHEYGRVLAGMRLTPTTAKCGQYSYMLRDAQLGLLENIPQDVLFFEAPVRPDIWEATRLFVSPSVASQRRLYIQTVLLKNMASAAYDLGAKGVIGIVPAVFSRWMKRIGMNATPIGPKMMIGNDHSQCAMMNLTEMRTA